MKILYLSAEVAPYVSVGGLSQVMYFLPRALRDRGHDVRVFTPRHGAMEKAVRSRPDLKFVTDVSGLQVPSGSTAGETAAAEKEVAVARHAREALEFGGSAERMAEGNGPVSVPSQSNVTVDIQKLDTGGHDAPAYFVVNKEYYGLRTNVFGYADDHVRFALLSRACLSWILEQQRRAAGGKEAWVPDVVHCHDWHAAYAIDLARHDPLYKNALQRIPFVLTVHNFRFQGNMDFRFVPKEERDDGSAPIAPLDSPAVLQKQNALMRGLMYADTVTTVSPTHAREILEPEYAEGLDETLAAVRGKMSGIMNGIDTKEFDPATDPIIAQRYSRRNFAAGRRADKLDLQREFGLPGEPEAMIFGFVGRLSTQKGLEMMAPALTTLLENYDDAQFVAVGGGEDRFRAGMEELRRKFPLQVGLALTPDFRLPRKLFAGADVILMPSVFEPGGIVALESLRYGAVPLVRRTGGLNDSVQDFDPETKKGNGFSFVRKSPWALYGAMVEAKVTYRQKHLWERLVANCLACDFSWGHAAEAYDDWYRRAADMLRRATPEQPRHGAIEKFISKLS